LTYDISPGVAAPQQITTFSVGTLPEDIVPVPSDFGTLGGTYFVDNPTINASGTGQVLNVTSGGVVTTFASFPSPQTLQPLGGAFLPSNYGAAAGQFLAAGENSSNRSLSQAALINSAGTVTNLPNLAGVGTNGWASVAVAPSTFGTLGGTVYLTNEGPNPIGPGTVYALNPPTTSDASTMTVSSFATITGGQPFGLVFAPVAFGSVGGDLLVSDSVSGKIWAVSPSGTVTLFATVPLLAGQFGNRQMAFAPAGFPTYAGDLFVSVSGSNFGGGLAGSVDVLNSSGGLVAFLAIGVDGSPYDPRGLLFPNSTTLWVNDADAGIFSAVSSDFTPTPVPAALPLFATAIGGLGLLGWRRKRKAQAVI
jgi:hypothetical protein